ncbi:MAG: dTDP-4-dehydrorhamnose reductase [bacterium]|jgi:dTDP-4-dehydrorhamnose reductase
MAELKKILVTGANGQLGKELRDISKEFNQYEFLFLSREDLPIHHYELVRNTFDAFKPDYCINCAAYTAVDRAEQESELAFIVNAESVGILAAVSAAHSTKFIHISTDYVYGGDSTIPYKETDPTSPQSVYGTSKKAGEDQAFKHNPESVVIRTSWVYSYHGHNFVKTMMRLMNEKEEINVVDDQRGSPTSAADLAGFIMYVIGYSSWKPGIYNFSNEGEITWYEFALEIKKLLDSKCLVTPIPTSAYPTPAKRPLYSVMDKTKIKEEFGYDPQEWKESLADCVKRLKEG